MKKLLLMLVLAAVACIGFAQVSAYTFGYSTGAYSEITGGTAIGTTTIGGVTLDNVTYPNVPIPFFFPFNGRQYNQVTINSNGYIVFGGTSAISETAMLSSTAIADGVVAIFGKDNKARTTDGSLGEIRCETLGSSPNQIFVIQWKNFMDYGGSSDVQNYQIRLYETTKVIQFVYGNVTIVNAETCLTGFRGLTNADFLTRTTTTDWAASTLGAANTSAMAVAPTIYPASGAIYTFTPPAPSTFPNLPTAVSPLNPSTGVFPNATLNWADGGGWTDGFKLYLGTTTLDYVGDLGYVTSYDPPGDMAYSTAHQWKVVPYNSQGDNLTGATWTFTTAGPPLTGTKTIGSGGDYATFTAAINDLNTVGVGTGGVTFNVAAGTYAENPPAINVTGTSANPIIFQAAPGARVNPVLTPAGGTGTFGFKLNGADWVTFDNIDVNGPATLIYGYWLAAVTDNATNNNTIKNCTITIPYGSSTNYAIYSYYATNAPNTGNTFLNNTIDSNTYYGIYVYGSSTSGNENQSTTIQGNTFTGIRNYAIYHYNGIGTVISGNTIAYANGTVGICGIYSNGATSTTQIYDNIIDDGVGGSNTSTHYGIYILEGTNQIYNNTIRNVAVTSSSHYVFYVTGGVNTIYSNTISDVSSTTGSMYAMYLTSGTNTVYDMTVYNLASTTGSQAGIYMYGGATEVYDSTFRNFSPTGIATIYGAYVTTGNHIVRNCTFHSYTSTGTVYGIYVSGGTSHNVYANNVYNLTCNSTSTLFVTGIMLSSATNYVYNNMIYDLKAPTATTAPQVRGITVTGGTAVNVWNNSVLLNATGTATNFGTAALYTSHTSTSGALDLKNNILVNKSTAAGTGKTVALHKSTTGFTVFKADSNKNVYYSNGILGLFGTTEYADLAAYKAVATVDQGSYSEDVPFLSSAFPYDLHINDSEETVVEANAIPIVTVNKDIDLEDRDGTTPDLGADEGVFTAIQGPPGLVALQTPANNSLTVNPTTDSFSWLPGEGGVPDLYNVYIADSAEGLFEASPIRVDYPTNTLAMDGLDLGFQQEWFWGVTALNGSGGEDNESDPNYQIFSFTTIPQMQVAQSTLPIGNIWANTTRTGTIAVQNLGDASISVSVTGPAEFVFAENPFTVNPRETFNLGYTFTAPATLGAYSQVITITHTGYSSKNITATATVQENPTIVSFPFVEGFETGNTDASTTIKNWTQQVGPSYTSYNWTANNIATSYNRTPRTGAWNAYLHYSGQAYLFRPIQLVGGTAYSLEFYARQDGATAANSWVKADLGTEATIAGMTTSIVPQTGIINGDYQRFYGTFTPATSGIYYVGIQGWMNGTPWYISLDDIKIDEVPLTPTFTLTPDVEEWNFGAVQKDLTATKQFTITNTGGGTLTINSVATTGQYYSISVEPNDLTLDMNQSTTFTVQYAPTAVTAEETQHQGLLTITHSEAGRTAVEIDLTGTCYDPTITVFPHTQNFGSTDAAFPPQYWNKYSGVLATPTVLGAENTGSWIRDDWKNVVTTPPNYAARINIFGSTANGWLISPPIAVPADDYELMFDVALLDYDTSNAPDLNGSDDIFAVLIGDGTSWAPANVARQWDNTVGATYVLNEIPHTGMTVNLPLGTAGTKYVAFYGISTESNADNDLMVDNVVFRHIPATPIFSLNPNETEYSFGNAVLDVPVTRQYTITNTGPGILTIDSIVATPGSDFSISVGPTDTALTNMESTTFTVQFLPSAAGLREGTITINHGVSESRRATHVIEMSGTGVDTTIYPPFTEYFDSVTAPALPLGWTKQVYSDYPGSYNVTNSTTGPYSTPNNIRFYSYYTNDDLILISPKVDGEISDIRVKFWSRYSTTATSLIVGTMDGIGTRAVFTPFQTVPITSTTNSRYAVDFADYEGTDRYVAFKLQVGASNATRYIYLDNVTFEEPQEEAPIAVTLNSPVNAAVTLMNPILKWTPSDLGEPATAYKVYMNTTGSFTEGDVVYTGLNLQYQTENTVANQQYFWKVAAVNTWGATDSAVWSFYTPGPNQLAESFENTTFPPVGWTNDSGFSRSTTTPYHLTASAYRATSTTIQYRLVTPLLDVQTGSTLSFYARTASANDAQRIQIKYSTDRATWSNVGDVIALTNAQPWTFYSVDLSGLATRANLYLAFEVYGTTTTGSVYIDHVVGPNYAAVAPAAVTLTAPAAAAPDQSVTPTFTWTPTYPVGAGMITGYKVYCDMTADPSTLIGSPTTNSFTPTVPLNYGANYNWKVVATNNGVDGPASEIRAFSTMADPTIYYAALPYTQNFDVSTAWPLGWAKVGTSGSVYVTTTNPNSTPNSIYIYSSGSTSVATASLPPVNMTSVGLKLKFHARSNYTTGGKLQIGYLTNPTDAATFVQISEVTTTLTHAQYSVPLGIVNGVKYFAIRANFSPAYSLSVDDVIIEESEANDLAATQISGPFQGVVNTQFSYQVTVANMGTAAQNAYTVELHSADTRALLTSISVTDALAPLGTAVHTLNWTPTTVADYNIYAKVVLTGDADTTNNQTANKAVGVYNPLSMPINETWDAFAGNHWTNTADGHWSVVSSGGNPGAAMKFSYLPTVTDYTSAFNSFVIDASAATGVRFKYDYYLDNHATTTIEGMRVEVYNGTAWTEIDNVTNQGGSIPWTTKTWDISSLVAGQMFKVRFITYGANSYNINYWYFDNIRFDVIPALLPQPTDLVVTQTGTNVNLNWTGTSTEGYKVYQSDDPYTWTGEGTLVATNTYSIPVGANPKKFFKVTGYFNSGAVPAPPTKQYRYNGSELIEPARAALFGEIERRK